LETAQQDRSGAATAHSTLRLDVSIPCSLSHPIIDGQGRHLRRGLAPAHPSSILTLPLPHLLLPRLGWWRSSIQWREARSEGEEVESGSEEGDEHEPESSSHSCSSSSSTHVAHRQRRRCCLRRRSGYAASDAAASYQRRAVGCCGGPTPAPWM
jgi:hypothetical protein